MGRRACAAFWMGERAAAWFSEILGIRCSLVYIPRTTVRPADPTYAPAGVRVSFADGFPFLLISQESLADLNNRLTVPLPMNRFRPNLVIGGGGPFLEDRLQSFRISDIDLRVVKPCARCVLTTTDQATSRAGRSRSAPWPPTARWAASLFGQNVIHLGTGRLSVGALLV
jgi:uncharacterized protein